MCANAGELGRTVTPVHLLSRFESYHTHMKNITDEDNFDEEVATGRILVDFWAEWCGPCHMMAPVLESFEQDQGIPVIKIDVDRAPLLSQRFQIMSIPTMILFEDGEQVAMTTGAKPQAELLSALNI